MERRGNRRLFILLIAVHALVFLAVLPCLLASEEEGSRAAPTGETTSADYRQVEIQGRMAKSRAAERREQRLSELNASMEPNATRLEQERKRVREKHDREKTTIEEYYRQEVGRMLPAERIPRDTPVGIRCVEALETSKREYESATARLDREAEELARVRAMRVAEIEKEYEDAVANADAQIERAKEMREYKGLRLPVDKTATFLVRKIEIRGNTSLSDKELLGALPPVYKHRAPSTDGEDPNRLYDFRGLRQIVAGPGQPQPVSTRTMEGLTRYILFRYQRAGYAGIYVYVSADAVVKGQNRFVDDILPVHVIEGRLATVEIERHRFEPADANGVGEPVDLSDLRFWLPPVFGPVTREHVLLKDELLEAWSPARPGEVICDSDLKHFLALLNTNPDRYAAAVMSAGEEPNTIDVTYELHEGDPWHFYTQVDDAGTDEQQWSPRIGLVNTNVTGRDDRASIMYQVDVEGCRENYAAFGTYDVPFLTPRLRVGVYGGYSRFEISPEATGGITSFLGDGSFFGTTLRYNLAHIGDWLFDLTGSVSSEESRVTRSLGSDSDIDLRMVGIGAQVHRGDRDWQSIFSFERSENVGGSDAEEFATARIGSDPDFVRYSAAAMYRQFIDANHVHEIRGSIRAVTSNERLVPAKMTTFGGLYTVRGYEEDEIVADGGILASLEYRFKLTGFQDGRADGAGGEQRNSRPFDMWLLGFTDYGRPDVKDPVPGEIDTQDMWGIGLGTLIEVGGSFQAAVYHSWALRETERADGSTITGRGDSQWNFSFIYRW